MKRSNRLRPTPDPSLTKATESLNEATKDLETALKEIEVALDKLEELSRLRKQITSQSPQPPVLPTPESRRQDEDRYPSSVPVYTWSTIVPVLITTFFRS